MEIDFDNQMESGEGNDRFERDVALTVSQYVLAPDIPFKEREFFEKFYMLFSKMMALGNIERYDMIGLLAGFDEVVLLLEMRLYQEARKVMGRILMEMQCSRSFGGFYTLYGQHGVERRESIQKILDQSRGQKGGFWGRLFKKKEQSPQQRPVGMERE